jgi:sugar/nucleoside kinase (ribokinase family)
MTPPLLCLSNIILDDLHLADGTHLPHTLGGAATYAATAARLFWPDVAIVAGVGEDFEETEALLARYGLRGGGYLRRSPHSIRSRLVYHTDGSRNETPAYGTEHFSSLQVMPDEVPPELLPAAGCYLFHDLEPRFWSGLQRMRDRLGTLLWEIHDNEIAGRWPDVAERMAMIDIVSCNLAEARSLFGPMPPEEMLDRLLEPGVAAVILRMGGDGALIATPQLRFRLTPPPSPVIDVTGGGNAFSGAFLAGWLASSGNAVDAARRAAAGAAHALAQFGPGDPSQAGDTGRWAAATAISSLDFAERKS